MGFRDEKGLHFSGRAKWIIKPAGHQVFPGDVESHICALEDKVAACAVVGVEHPLLSEAIVAFVERRPGAILTPQELRRHAKGLASYMRPLRYVLLEPGGMPLNRAAKIDYLRLQQMATADANVNLR
jgi:acyl-coenzyme A synthetase/AMP-(fatty) acid ligase